MTTPAAGHDHDPPQGPRPRAAAPRRSWWYVARTTFHAFGRDHCTDSAAALTYYAVFALFHGLIALLSVIDLVGDGQAVVDTLARIAEDVGGASVAGTLRPTLEQLADAPGAGVALIAGLAVALWSASGYVSAFGRALNRMYRVEEGRPFWRFRPTMLAVTAVVVLLAALVLMGLVITGPAAAAVGRAIGLGPGPVLVWSIAKWPVMLLVTVLVVALLYWATPNVRQPRFRWLSVGAALAIVVWMAASVAFGFYVAHVAGYGRTYGSLAGVVVFLLWLWITNLALLFGAELDAELERGRELRAGIAAEEHVRLPLRDTRRIEREQRRREEYVRRGREVRLAHRRGDEDADPPAG